MPSRSLLTLLGIVATSATACSDAGPGASTGSGGSTVTPVDPSETGARFTCGPGEWIGEDGSCEPPGLMPSDCGTGFEHDGDVGCTPILPATPCGPGEVALLGETSCRLLSSCASPEAPPSAADVQHVDASFGGASDGSAGAPWTTVADAVAAGTSGTLVVIAPGTYVDPVALSVPMTLWGSCAAGVSLTGGVTIAATADGAALHHLAVSAPQVGIQLSGASDVHLGHVRVHDTGWAGVVLIDTAGPTSLVMEDSLVERATAAGLSLVGSSATLRRTIVRDTQTSQGEYGFGIDVFANSQVGTRSSLTLEQSVVEGSTTAGVTGLGADVVVDESLIRGVSPHPGDMAWGYALGIEREPVLGARGTITVRRSLIEQAAFCGVCGWDSDVTVERSVIRDIVSEVEDGHLGSGIRVLEAAEDEVVQSTLVVDRTLVERTQMEGIATIGGVSRLSRIVVRDVTGQAKDGNWGHLVTAQASYVPLKQGHIDIQGALLQRGSEVGFSALGATIDAAGITVEDVSPRPDGLFGAPLVVSHDIVVDMPSGGTVREVRIDGGHTGGFVVLGSDVVASDIDVTGILPEVYADDFGDGIIASGFIFSPKLYEANVALTRVTVDSVPRAGIAAFSAAVSLERAYLDCNPIQLAAEPVLDGEVSLSDGGANRCGCGSEQAVCKVLTSGLQPPTPPL